MPQNIKSIVSTEHKCFICGRTTQLECHHIFGGPSRPNSTKYGLVVYLCHQCHNEPPYGVHFNRERMDWLRAIGQRAFMEHYPNLDFMKIFHRNYIFEEDHDD